MKQMINICLPERQGFHSFVTCGDPSLDVTEQIVYAMADAGADLIELGIPFSGPDR